MSGIRPDETRAPAQSAEESGATLSPIKRALQEIRQLRAQLAEVEAASPMQRHPIAIVGAGMRFPGGVVDAGSFWELLAEGRDGITEIPPDRWDSRLYFNRNPDTPGAMNSIRGGFLDGVDEFDADFFGLSPREAAMLDPQQRLLHEVAWHALEDAAIRPDQLGLSRTGIFMGLSNFDYYRAVLQDDLRIDAYAGSGNSPSMAAGRLAYTLGVRGPAMMIDTSCSSSLSALHLACQSLRAGESDLALAGAVNVILGPQIHIGFSRAHMLAPDGRCKTFDEAADGYVRSEGCAVVVLKRLKDAVEAGDRVLAVVRGTAVNHDGRSAGLTAPSREAQAQLLREAYSHAGVSLDDVGMIEAHGTGTSLGDPIEMEALGEVFAGRPAGRSPIAVGSVKTNLGHTEVASGMAGLLKAVLSLQHRQIPRHLNLEKKSAYISWADIPFHVPLELMEWKLEAGQRRRIAGVSSFGFSGSNAHVVLEEFVSTEPDEQLDAEQEPQAFVLSGRSKEALAAAQSALEKNLRGSDDISLRDVCHTLSRGRMHHAYRRAYVVSTRAELLQRMNSEMGGAIAPKTDLAYCFLFTGQGSEHTGMGLELYARSGVFRAAVDRLEGALDGHLGKSVREIWANANREQERPSLVQPALYAYGWALSELWRSWNVQPRVVLGHSLGEYVAATVACVMTPEEGIRLVAARGRLIEGLVETGAMVAVAASKPQVDGMIAAASLGGELSFAAINGPASVVVSGRRKSIDTFEQKLREASVRHKRLRTTHGFHSAVLDGMLDAFEAEASAVAFQIPEVPWISNLTGTLVQHDSPIDAQYWRQHLRQTVEFSQGLATARALEVTAFLEIGAEPHLSALAEANDIAADACIPSIGKGAATGEWQSLLTAATRLYTGGTELDWEAVADRLPYRKIALPGYPFQRERFWFNTGWPKGEEASASMAQAAANRASMVPIGLPAANIAPGLKAVNGWAVALMLATLRDLGCFNGTDDRLDSEAIIGRYGVPLTHRRLMERWLRRLSSEGILRPLEDGENPVYAITTQTAIASAESIWAETEQLGDEPLRRYLANCAVLLPRVLRGEVNPLETLFPGGDDRLAKSLYEESPASLYVNRIAAAVIAVRMHQPAQTAMGYPRRLHILEVGAGTGATTSTVLAELDPQRVVYTFSDVSEVFLARARQRFHGHPMEFALFDLDRADHAAAHQGRYDVVLAANSLHAAKDLRAGLVRLFDALQPGGSLVLVETTADHAWHEVSTGLIEGWQHFTDESRSNGSPLLPPDRWAEELALAGFQNFCAAPTTEQATHPLGLHVLIAHKPSHAQASRASGTIPSTALEGLTFFAASEPATNELGDGAATRLVGEIAAASPRQRARLAVEAVTRAVAEVLGRTALPGKDERLMELGLDSLMALELRNRLQTAFGMERLSSTLVFDYPTSEAIARFLLAELDRKLNGREIDLAREQEDAPVEGATAAASLHSVEELDQMSNEEIAELLRKQLE